jgi:pimeloyl-ACP methyl ester carboxylesterase
LHDGRDRDNPAVRSVSTAIACAATLVGVCATTAAQPGGPATSAKLGACPKHVRPQKLRCGSLVVPLERADPSLGTIPIRYAVRARSHANRPSEGTIFAVEGGPGYGSIASARYYVHLFGPLLATRELVLVDMRGTGHSRAIDCPALQAGRGSDSDGLAQCARRLGSTFGSYRTSAAADDIDAVRAVLGIERIDLYGDSYGTFLSQSYAYRHGETLDALVLDGAYPVRGESPWYPSLTRTGIRSLAIACRRSAGCRGDPGARLKRIVSALRDTPRGVGPLLDAIGSGGYSPPGSYLKIDRAISRYLAGDRTRYARLTAPGSGGYGSPRYYSRGDELAVSCNDYPMLWDKAASESERRAQLAAAVRDYPQQAFAPFTPREVALEGQTGYLECLRWPQPTDLYQPPAPPGAAAPAVATLVIAGELDDVTSPAEGRMVAEDFPGSRLMLVRNAGHVPSLYGHRYPAAARVRAFLRRHG